MICFLNVHDQIPDISSQYAHVLLFCKKIIVAAVQKYCDIKILIIKMCFSKTRKFRTNAPSKNNRIVFYIKVTYAATI